MNFNKLCSMLKDMICELYFLCGPFLSAHHKYVHWLQNETENSVLALKSLNLLPLCLACLCMPHPLVWIIYRCNLFISQAWGWNIRTLLDIWIPLNCRIQLPFKRFLFNLGVVQVGQMAILPSTLRKKQFWFAWRGRLEIKQRSTSCSSDLISLFL